MAYNYNMDEPQSRRNYSQRSYMTTFICTVWNRQIQRQKVG